MVSDACPAANLIDGVLLLVLQNRSKKDAVRRAVSNLQLTGANLLGFVLNDAELLDVKPYSNYG